METQLAFLAATAALLGTYERNQPTLSINARWVGCRRHFEKNLVPWRTQTLRFVIKNKTWEIIKQQLAIEITAGAIIKKKELRISIGILFITCRQLFLLLGRSLFYKVLRLHCPRPETANMHVLEREDCAMGCDFVTVETVSLAG